jgi:Ca2+-binding EF-hand superfamily protein
MNTTRSKKVKFDPKDHIRDGFTEDEIECIKEAFDLFDNDGKGTID